MKKPPPKPPSKKPALRLVTAGPPPSGGGRDVTGKAKGTGGPVGVKPRGRPPDGEEREPLVSVTFKADPEVQAALAELEAALGGAVLSRRSVACRKAILVAREQLHAGKRCNKAHPPPGCTAPGGCWLD